MSGPDLRSAEQFLPDQIPSLHARAADRVGTSVSPTCEVTAPMSVESTTLERSALERKDREELTTIAQALGAKPPSRARKAEIVQLILELTGVESSAPGDATERKRTRTTNGGKEQEASSVDDTSSETDTGARREAGSTGSSGAGSGGDDAAVEFDIPTGTTVVDDTDGDASDSGGPVVTGARAVDADAEEPPAEWELAVGESDSATTTSTTTTGGDADTHADDRDAGNGQACTDREPRDRGKGEGRQGGERDKAADRQGDGKGADQSRDEGRQGGERQGGDQRRDEDRQGGDPSAQAVDVNEPGNRRRRRRGRRGGNEQQTHVEEYTGEPVEVES